MKKSIIILTFACAVAMIFSSCTKEPAVPQNSQNGSQTQTSSPSFEDALMFLDGTKAVEDEIVEFEKADRFNQSQEDKYTVNVCFCVPFGTSSDKRMAFEKGNWVKLKEGAEINGFTVEKAESHYFQPIQPENYLFLPVKLVQKVSLKGDFSCVGEAYKSLAPDGTETGAICIVPDSDTLKKLFSLKPALKSSEDYREFEDTDNYFENEEKVIFYISDETTGFKQIMDELSGSESVKVKLEADSFEISYNFETGNSHDGSNVGTVNGGTVSLAA